MREVTNLIINKHNMYEKGYDFMGYNLNRPVYDEACDKDYQLYLPTFHHVFIPHILCLDWPTEGYEEWNGVVLSSVSHEYLHRIQRFDPYKYDDITLQMIAQKRKINLDPENIYRIHELLFEFEEQWKGALWLDNEPLIKDVYTKRLERVR